MGIFKKTAGFGGFYGTKKIASEVNF